MHLSFVPRHCTTAMPLSGLVSGDRKWHVAQPQRHNAASQGQGYAREYQEGIAGGVESTEEQEEDQEETQGDHQTQALPCSHEVFELTTPVEPAPRREGDLGVDAPLRLGDE